MVDILVLLWPGERGELNLVPRLSLHFLPLSLSPNDKWRQRRKSLGMRLG